MSWMAVDLTILYTLQFITVIRALTRENRAPASRMAWILVIMALPGVGIILYFLLGEVSFGRRTVARLRAIRRRLPVTPPAAAGVLDAPHPAAAAPKVDVGEMYAAFARAAATNKFEPTAGNLAKLMADSDVAIDRMVADIDAARRTVHILVYIWLDDNNGRKLMAACERAAARGVKCRCLVDGLGSRKLVRSASWRRMLGKGVEGAQAFTTRWPLLRMMIGRIDIRNHRKIVVIDGKVNYCGSQNCADPAFRIKAKYAPWYDIMLRVEGPVVWQAQQIFVTDWMCHAGEDISALLDQPAPAPAPDGFTAIAFGSGPEVSLNSVPDVYSLALGAARDRVCITTPYFVPSMALEDQLRATALRGVSVTLILPRRNDSRFVAFASRSYYRTLLEAGVRIFEFRPGLLHAKTLTADGRFSIVGSANLDRRSFELNFENNMLIEDGGATRLVVGRQADYLGQSDEVTLAAVKKWSWMRRLAYNLVATVGPVL